MKLLHKYLLMRKKSDNMQAQQVQSNIQLVNTYSEIVKSPRILDEVAKNIKNIHHLN